MDDTDEGISHYQILQKVYFQSINLDYLLAMEYVES